MASLVAPACTTVGPDHVPPAPAAVAPPVFVNAPPRQADDIARWWERLQDPELSSLVRRAVAGNLDLQTAEARIREARAVGRVARSGDTPSVGLSAGISRQRLVFDPEGRDSVVDVDTLYQTGFDARWEADLFGGRRRSVEAADARAQAAEETRNAILVSLTAEVVRSYVALREAQARLAVARANLAVQERTVELTERRVRAGEEAGLAEAAVSGQAARTASAIPGLERDAKVNLHRLAVLLGRTPGEMPATLETPPARPIQADLDVAAGAPADLLRRRPDIRAAERRLAAETADIGVAKAELRPRFDLLGTVGAIASTLTGLTVGRVAQWSFGAGLDVPVLDGGARRARVAGEEAQRDSALLGYRAAVLSAVEEVENGFVAYARERERRDRLRSAADRYGRAVGFADQGFRRGELSYLEVLDAQRQLYAVQDELASSEAAVAARAAALFKALGGGWEAGGAR